MNKVMGIRYSHTQCGQRQGRIQGFRKGGNKKIEVTVHVMVPSTGRRASPGGGLEGGVPPPELEKKLK